MVIDRGDGWHAARLEVDRDDVWDLVADVVNPQAIRLYAQLMLLDLRLRLRVRGSILGAEKVVDAPLGEQGRTPAERRRNRR